MKVSICYTFYSCLRMFYKAYRQSLYSKNPNNLPAQTTLELEVVGSSLCL